MSPAERQFLLVLSLAAIWGAASRGAAALGARGLERAVAAAPFAGAALVIEVLALGLLGVSDKPGLLAGLAVVTWLGARFALPAPGSTFRSDLSVWWRGTGRAERALVVAAGGVGAAFALFILRHPVIGVDGVSYHLSEAVAWAQSGHAGQVVQSFYDLPTGNYPLTNDVLLGWVVSLSGSLAPAMLVSPLEALLLAASAWLSLRRLGVAREPAALAALALLTVPFVVSALAEPGTDLAAGAWLACAAALTASAPRRPALLGPAIVAAGLSVGSKTTSLPLVLVLLATGLYTQRRRLRQIWRPLAVGAVLACLAGLVWYARNLIDHGSPLWPFVRGPWGDPLPQLLNLFSHSFLDRPRVTLEGRTEAYYEALGGALVLIAAALAAPAAAPRRRVLLAAGVTLAALLAWVNSPVTGLSDVIELNTVTTTAIRYLLPVLLAATLTIALASRDGLGRRLAPLALVAAVVVNLAAAWPFEFARGPSLKLVAAVVVAALAAAWALARVPSRLAMVAAGVLAVVGLNAAASGFTARHAELGSTVYSQLATYLLAQPGFRSGHEPVAVSAGRPAILAGDRLRHRVELIPAHEPCARIAARRERSWVILTDAVVAHIRGRPGANALTPGPAHCLIDVRPAARTGPFRVFAPQGFEGRR